MATSNVSIANLALQKLGEPTIVSLTEDSRNARSMNACFEAMRDRELRAYAWHFTKKRATLAPSSVAPEFQYTYAFPLPSNYLRLIKFARAGSDWHLEQHEGALAILTNDGNALEIRYQAKVTDPTLFDPIFVDMLACKLAWHCCEQITQSNAKKDALMQEYVYHRAEARRTNAFEVTPPPQPVDDWITARRTGSLVGVDWDEE